MRGFSFSNPFGRRQSDDIGATVANNEANEQEEIDVPIWGQIMTDDEEATEFLEWLIQQSRERYGEA